MSEIMVSIDCAAYNHEKYIADAIESFLMQKTDFKFEIIIHDDASTDGTKEIIQKYENLYPDIIKPIYQTENQDSKGVSVTEIILKRARGKYIAVCEGDDYWTDPYKLQKQVDYMEEHPECSLCVTGGTIVNALDKKLIAKHRPNDGNGIFTVHDVITGGGGLFLSNSMLFRRTSVVELPQFFRNAPIGDYPLTIYLAFLGTVYYIDEQMSAYRVGVQNSWTSMHFNTIENKERHFEQLSKMLDEINEYSNYMYDESITYKKNLDQFNLLLDKGKFKEAKIGKYKNFYKRLSYTTKMKLFTKHFFPNLTRILISLKRKLVH